MFKLLRNTSSVCSLSAEILWFVFGSGWGLFPRRSGFSGASGVERAQITQSGGEADGVLLHQDWSPAQPRPQRARLVFR